MVPRTNVPPTRAGALQARRDLAFAKEAYDVLDHKRQALLAYLIKMLDDADSIEKRVDDSLMAAHEALSRARMSMGVERVEETALSISKTTYTNILERSIMGVPVPTVEAPHQELRLQYSLSGTTASIDEAVKAFGSVLAIVCQAAEVEAAVWRLFMETKKTQRRLNAISEILIPNYTAIVRQIERALEEREREDFYRAKAVKRLHQRGVLS